MSEGKPPASDAAGAVARPWAEGVPYEQQVQAREPFMEGNVLLRDTLVGGAAAKYERARYGRTRLHYNLALARERAPGILRGV